jgi:hypothetical protein
MVSLMATRPTEASDLPGIHTDAERESAGRPTPRGVRGTKLVLRRIPADTAQHSVIATTFSDSSGGAYFWGDAVAGKTDRIQLTAVRKGFRPMAREFSQNEVRDLSLTIVLDEIAATEQAPPTQPEGAPKPTTGETGETGKASPGGAAPEETLLPNLALPVRHASGDAPAPKEDPSPTAGEADGKKPDHEDKPASPPTPTKPPKPGEVLELPDAPNAADMGHEPVNAYVEPDGVPFDRALSELRAAVKSLGWTIRGIQTREDGTIHPPGWPKVQGCRAIQFNAPAKDKLPRVSGVLFCAQGAKYDSPSLRKARSADAFRADYLGELASYQFFLSPNARSRATELRSQLRFQ